MIALLLLPNPFVYFKSITCLPLNLGFKTLKPSRLYLDQGFDEGKGNENGKVRQSNRSGPLDLFPFPLPNS